MSAPSPRKGRGRGVAKPRWYRWNPQPRKPEAADDELVAPEHVWSLPLARRPIPPGEPDPARARWVRLVLDDPAAARRERLEQRLQYWRARLAQHEERLDAIRAELDAALFPSRDARQAPVPPGEVFRLWCEFAVCWADVQAAKAELRRIEAELADA